MLLFIVLVIGGTTYTLFRLRSETLDAQLEISATYAHVFEDHLTQTLKFIRLILTQSINENDLNQPPEQVSALLARTVRQTPALRSISLID